MATFTATTATDNFIGAASDNDILKINSQGVVQAGDVFNGGLGTDTIEIGDTTKVSLATLTSAPLSFEAVKVLGDTEVVFWASSFSSTALSTSMNFIGTSGKVANIKIYGSATAATTIDARNFTYTDWNTSSKISMYAGSANDTLYSGTNSDYMAGGNGSDTYYVNSSRDTIYEIAGTSAGANDRVFAATSYTLSANVEKIELTGTAGYRANGNTLNNELKGNTGNNTLNGGSGADTMIGRAGDDTYYVDNAADVVTEVAGEGTDTLITTLASTTLAATLENITLNGSRALNADGNASNNVMKGSTAANLLRGLSGNDYIDGGSGIDTMVGGSGDDTFVSNYATEVTTELANQGNDTIITTVNRSLSETSLANIENITLSGSARNATGNAVDNKLTGNNYSNILEGLGGNDTLDGGLGSDTMRGGLGNDTYYVGSSGDVTTELANEGTDTVIANISGYTLADNIENLVMESATGTGNALNNTITVVTGSTRDH
jgi:trimeric autotransporter adhesin